MTPGLWLAAARPRTLAAAIVPVLVGTALAFRQGELHALAALAALLGAIWIQIGTNFANDYFDGVKGTDKDRVGPLRVMQAGLVSAGRMKAAIALAFGMAGLCGLYLVWVGGWPILLIGVLSILSGLAYTGGPYPLGYNGLGDLFVFVFFGLVAVGGTYYVQAHQLHPLALWLAVPVGFLATAILAVNNLRDAATDAPAGKRTLVVRFGENFGRMQVSWLVAGAFAIPLMLVFRGKLGVWGLLPLASLPLAFPIWKAVLRGARGSELNDTLARTAKLMMVFGALLALGVVL